MDAQELRRRWTDKTNAVFGPRDRIDYQEYPAENYEREVDFRGCRSIVFLHGERTGTEEDVLLLAQGSGHMTLPAGVMMLVDSGFCKWAPAASAGGGSTVVGMGARAPPPSRASGYARSSADSSYSAQNRGQAASSYRPSPPRDAASFIRGGPGSSYMSACQVPLPQSTVVGRRSSADSDDWEVVGQMRMDDACSIAPSESISSVGSRGGGYQNSRRYNQGY